MTLNNIVIDTNLLYEANGNNIFDYNEFILHPNYYDILRFLEIYELDERYRVWVPEIVFSELEKQRLEKYNNSVDTLKKEFEKIQRFTNTELNLPDLNYKLKIQELIEQRIKKDCINVLNIPITADVFRNIINRVKNKEKPFCGEKGKTDKGFKDVLLWESILYKARNDDKEENYILVTENKKDFPLKLIEEFEQEVGGQIEFFYNISEMQENILKINEIEKNIYTEKMLLDSEELIFEINSSLIENGYEKIVSIDKISDLVFEGNNNYKLIVIVKNEEESECCIEQYYLEITISDGEIEISEILPAI